MPASRPRSRRRLEPALTRQQSAMNACLAKANLSRRSLLAKADTPSENRVWGFFCDPPSRTLSTGVKTQCSRPENRPNPTTTASGVLFYGYRYYSPGMGRWVNRDPIGERGGVNVYGFAGNCALGFYDHLGLAITSVELLPLQAGSHFSIEAYAALSDRDAADWIDMQPMPSPNSGQTDQQNGQLLGFGYFAQGNTVSAFLEGRTDMTTWGTYALLQLSADPTWRVKVEGCCNSGFIVVTWRIRLYRNWGNNFFNPFPGLNLQSLPILGTTGGAVSGGARAVAQIGPITRKAGRGYEDTPGIEYSDTGVAFWGVPAAGQAFSQTLPFQLRLEWYDFGGYPTGRGPRAYARVYASFNCW